MTTARNRRHRRSTSPSRRRSRSRSQGREDRRDRGRRRSRDRSYSPDDRRRSAPHSRRRGSPRGRTYRDAIAAGLEGDLEWAPPERPASVLRVENLPREVDDAELSALFARVPGAVSVAAKRRAGDSSGSCVGYAVLVRPQPQTQALLSCILADKTKLKWSPSFPASANSRRWPAWRRPRR